MQSVFIVLFSVSSGAQLGPRIRVRRVITMSQAFPNHHNNTLTTHMSQQNPKNKRIIVHPLKLRTKKLVS